MYTRRPRKSGSDVANRKARIHIFLSSKRKKKKKNLMEHSPETTPYAPCWTSIIIGVIGVDLFWPLPTSRPILPLASIITPSTTPSAQ